MRSSPPKDFNFNQTMELSAAYSWQSSLSVWPPVRLPLEVSLGEVMIHVRDWPWTPTPRRKPQCWPLSHTSLRLWASSSKFLHFQILAAHVLPLGQWQDGPKLCRSSRYPWLRRRSHPSDLRAQETFDEKERSKPVEKGTTPFASESLYYDDLTSKGQRSECDTLCSISVGALMLLEYISKRMLFHIIMLS